MATRKRKGITPPAKKTEPISLPEMDWAKLLNAERLGHRVPRQELGRSPFNADHDKIIFSGAFRRLAKKTQVHPLATNDHVHNRLTHSLEVSCVGRSLGIRVGQMLFERKKLPDPLTPTDIGDIVQSTCLAHDIGNPPFGHTGEEAIRNWFRNDGHRFLAGLQAEEVNDLRTFEGNAQGLRVLTSAEYHPYEGGMRLTYATLASFIKYPWTSLPAAAGKRPKKSKYGVFRSELETFHEIATSVGLTRRPGDDWFARHPLVHLMEAADDFCYGIIDLEDGLEMGILKWEKLFEILEPVLPRKEVKEVLSDIKKVGAGRRPPLLRGKVIAAYINSAADAFIRNEREFLAGSVDDLISLCAPAVVNSVKKAKEVANTEIFSHRRKIELEIGAYNVVSTLLEVMCCAATEWINDKSKMSFRSRRAIDLIGEYTFHPSIRPGAKPGAFPETRTPTYLAIMRVIDFVSGMTDNYATYLAKQFNGMGESR